MNHRTSLNDVELNEKFFVEFAAAFVQSTIGSNAPLSELELVRKGLAAGLDMYRFKRTDELPRVRRVLGFLRAIRPQELVDFGTGRGVFLWPLLSSLPEIEVTCVDILRRRIAVLEAVQRGGVDRLHPQLGDIRRPLDLPAKSCDVVTALEVLEHLDSPFLAVKNALRLARSFVVASVPSKADENPEHIQLFSPNSLAALFLDQGATGVDIEHVRGHMVAIVKV